MVLYLDIRKTEYWVCSRLLSIDRYNKTELNQRNAIYTPFLAIPSSTVKYQSSHP